MSATLAPDEPCQATRRIDYLTAVHVSASPKGQQEVFDHCIAIGEDIDGSLRWHERGQSGHFQRVFSHDIGLRIELTELEGASGRNPGMTVLSLPGAAFYLLPSDRQMLMVWKVLNGPGFKWLSRVDLQNTELQPEWDADRIHLGLAARELWVAGYRAFRTWAEVDGSGDCPDGRTIYWGSPRSERQARTYDKGRQMGWPQPAIRDEVQLRGEWAHAAGRELDRLLKQNLSGAQMDQAVQRFVTSSLNQHLQYWELNGADPKADKNWKRQAVPADWYQQRIGKHCEPIQKAPREKLDLERAYAYGIRQYGRAIALRTLSKHKDSGLPVEDLLAGFWDRCYALLKREDLELLYGHMGAEKVDQMAALAAELADEHARNSELSADG